MHCEVFLARLDHCVETRVAPGILLKRHATSCSQPECQCAWSDFLLLEEAIPSWKAVEQFSQPVPEVERKSAFSGASVRRGRAIHLRGTLTWGIACLFCAVTAAVPLHWNRSSSISEFAQDASRENPVHSTMMPDSQGESVTAKVPASQRSNLSIDWIAVAPMQVSSSMAYMLLGAKETNKEPSVQKNWLEGWPSQILPTDENLEVLRELLIEHEPNQTLRDIISLSSRLS